MATLQELRNSLTTVIVRYCIQNTPPAVAFNKQEQLQAILSKSSEDMLTELDTLILESTQENETRRPLLHYLLHGIKQINLFLDCHEPASEEQASTLQDQLVQLIVNIQHLLKTPQSATVLVNHDGNEQAITGLIRGVFQGYSFCKSGAILNETLLLSKATQETIPLIIAGMIKIQCLQQEIHQLQAALKETALKPLQDEQTKPQEGAKASLPATSTPPSFRGDLNEFFNGLLFFSTPSANQSGAAVVDQQPIFWPD